MGLTLLSFIAALLLFLMVPATWRRARLESSGFYITLVNLFLGFFALFHGLVETISGLGESPVGLLCSRIAVSSLAFACVFLVVASLAFPRWLGLWAKVVSVFAVLAGIGLTYVIFATDSYMRMVFGVVDGVIRFVGTGNSLITTGIAGTAVVASVIHLVRGILTKDRIHSQRSIVASVGGVVGVVGMWFVGNFLADAMNTADKMAIIWSYYLLPVPAVVIGGSVSYALFISRIFDWSVFGRRLLSYALLALLFGVPAGAAVAALLVMGRLNVLIPVLGTPLVFLLARRLATGFAARRLERMFTHEYREELESALSHVDLSAGRDAVLAEVHRLLASALDFVEFAVFIEDDHGSFKTVYSSAGRTTTVERGSRLHDVVEASGVTVLLRSEAMADPRFKDVKDELLGFFDLFKGEAMVFTREGRRIIGAFVLGARRTGSDYTDYDYDSFKAIYGKLFVISYYLKNVARESIVYTVSRELALSDQVVRFALEKVDRIEDPAVDAAWKTLSTRSLGGDFIDFVRISKRRWFFVLGDISGKGLSASMNMLILKSMIRTFLRVERDFTSLVQKVNAFIKENLPRGTFFAGIFGYFDFEKNALYFINCGVSNLLLYSPSFDAFIEVQGEGRILGFVRDVAPFLKPRKLTLPPGSILIASTDGVVDSENLRGDRFGKDRLVRAAHQRLAASSADIAGGIVEDLLDFTGRKQEDDITLLVLKLSQRSEK
jgi:hypothetical protein